MGEKPDVIASEIEGLRRETDVIVDELMRRVTPQNLVQEVTGSVTHRANSLVSEAQGRVATVVDGARARIDPALSGASARASMVTDNAASRLPEPVRRYSTFIGGGLIAMTIGLGMHAIGMVSAGRDAMEEEWDLDYTPPPRPWYDLRDNLAGALSQVRSAADRIEVPSQVTLPSDLKLPSELRLPSGFKLPAGLDLPATIDLPGKLKMSIYHDTPPRRRHPGMMKRVLWMALASGMATLGSMLFKRLTASAWRGTMREEPPR